ncbi:Response regulator receiver protein [Gammaproteobacteria bacterium]
MFKERPKKKILIVDDAPENIMIISGILQDDYEIIAAINGSDAIETASSEKPDLILLDVVMPEMDGYTVCGWLKASKDTRKIPVIFVTSNNNQEDVARGMEVGAFYYIVKPVNAKTIRAVVKAALSSNVNQFVFRSSSQTIDLLKFAEEMIFRVRIMEDALHIAYMLSEICPEPSTTYTGLRELIVNAIEHGSLKISYREKYNLVMQNRWELEIERRQALPENQNKYITISFLRKKGEIRFTIKDEGAGFNWRPYFIPDPVRAFNPIGHGIGRAKTLSFDRLEYRGIGNEVSAVIYTDKYN